MFNKDSIRIEVPQRLKKFLANPSSYVDKTMKDADKEALTTLKTDIKTITHKKSGKLAGSIQIDLMGRKVYSKSPYSRAYQLGHYAVPVRTPKRMFLKFVSRGKEVFIKFARTKKQRFFFETLDKDRRKIVDIYDKAFKRLLESI